MSEEKTRESEITSSSISIKKSTYNNLIKGVVIAIAVASFVSGYLVGTFNDDSNTNLTTEELERIIDEIKVNSAPQPSQQPTQQPSQPSTPQVIMVSLDDDPVKGNLDAPITIVEFSDFQCPFCASWYQKTYSSIDESYIKTGKVKFVYRDFPLDRIHPNARAASIASECADEQGKFWEYHDVLFNKQTEWQRLPSTEFTLTLKQYATDLGLKDSSFESCLNSQEIADEVNKDSAQARGYGVSSTPTFFIGNEKDRYTMLTGAHGFASFQKVIDKLLG